MSPARQPYRASESVCSFFERFRVAITSQLSPELCALQRTNQAELRGGGASGLKKHHHQSSFKDVYAGFEYILWSNHLGVKPQEAGLGLYATGRMFKEGVHEKLGQLIRTGAVRDRIIDLGFDVARDQPQPDRDRRTGVWLAKRVVLLSFDDQKLADDLGARLGALMSICHPMVQQLIRRDYPNLIK